MTKILRTTLIMFRNKFYAKYIKQFYQKGIITNNHNTNMIANTINLRLKAILRR